MYVCMYVCMCARMYVCMYVKWKMYGKCLQSNVIYQATVTTATTTETYVGLATNFKECYRNKNIFGLYNTLRNLSR